MTETAKRAWTVALSCVTALALVAVPITANAQGDILRKILKVGGTSIVLDRFGNQIDKFINTLLDNRGIPQEESTKVVPIVTLGSGGQVGAAQVGGPKDKVDRVKAVLQLEGTFRGNSIRARALIPVDSKNILKPGDINKVRGVGLTALIDIEL